MLSSGSVGQLAGRTKASTTWSPARTALWKHVVEFGGNLNAEQLTDYLRGERDVSDVDRNVVVHAINEVFVDRGDNHRPRFAVGHVSVAMSAWRSRIPIVVMPTRSIHPVAPQ